MHKYFISVHIHSHLCTVRKKIGKEIIEQSDVQNKQYFGMARAPEFHVYSCIPTKYTFVNVKLYLTGKKAVYMINIGRCISEGTEA